LYRDITKEAKNVLAVELTEALQVIHGSGVAHQVKQDVLESAGVSVGQHEAITVSLKKKKKSKVELVADNNDPTSKLLRVVC